MSVSDRDIEAVLNRIVDGIASDEDKQILGDWLRSGPDARKQYRQFMALHSALHWDYMATAVSKPTAPEPLPFNRLTLLSRVVTFACLSAALVTRTNRREVHAAHQS